jgi:hypothetical protein
MPERKLNFRVTAAAGSRRSTSGQLRRQGAIATRRAGDLEPHDGSGRSTAVPVPQGDHRSDPVTGEIDDHVEPLPRHDLQGVVGDRRGQQPSVATDLLDAPATG